MFQNIMKAVNIQALTTQAMAYVPKLFVAIVLILVFWILMVIVRKILLNTLTRSGVPDDAKDLLARFAKYAVIVLGALTILDQLGIPVGTLIVGLGVAGLALSFAAQDTIANAISGVTVIIDQPLRTGDWVQIGDIHASVSRIRLRTTVLTTFDNETMVLPNRILSQERIINYTLTPRIRIRVPVGVAYKEDISVARKIMLSTLKDDSRVLDTPSPLVIVSSLDDSSVNLELRFWTEDALQKWPLQWEYAEKCKRALDEADIEIPFPHLQLFLETTAAVSQLAGKTEQAPDSGQS